MKNIKSDTFNLYIYKNPFTQAILIQPVTRVTGEAGSIRTGRAILAGLNNVCRICDRSKTFIREAIHFRTCKVKDDGKEDAMDNCDH